MANDVIIESLGSTCSVGDSFVSPWAWAGWKLMMKLDVFAVSVSSPQSTIRKDTKNRLFLFIQFKAVLVVFVVAFVALGKSKNDDEDLEQSRRKAAAATTGRRPWTTQTRRNTRRPYMSFRV
jgi:hypothetical protein